MLPEGLLQTAHLARVDAYLSCSSHCCHQYPTRNCLRVEGLLLLAYGSRETFYSQPGNGSEQKVGTSYQTPRPAPGIPLPPAGLHFLKFPSPRQSAVDQISNTGANGKHVTSKSQQFLTEFQDLSPGYTQFCAGKPGCNARLLNPWTWSYCFSYSRNAASTPLSHLVLQGAVDTPPKDDFEFLPLITLVFLPAFLLPPPVFLDSDWKALSPVSELHVITASVEAQTFHLLGNSEVIWRPRGRKETLSKTPGPSSVSVAVWCHTCYSWQPREWTSRQWCVRIQSGHLICDVTCCLSLCRLGQLEEMGAIWDKQGDGGQIPVPNRVQPRALPELQQFGKLVIRVGTDKGISGPRGTLVSTVTVSITHLLSSYYLLMTQSLRYMVEQECK